MKRHCEGEIRMIVYEGIVEKVGRGVVNPSEFATWEKFSVVKIGGKIIQNIYMSQGVASMLDLGVHVKLKVHRWVLISKLALSAEHENGDRIKLGFGTFLFYSFGLALFWIMIGGLAGGIIGYLLRDTLPVIGPVSDWLVNAMNTKLDMDETAAPAEIMGPVTGIAAFLGVGILNMLWFAVDYFRA